MAFKTFDITDVARVLGIRHIGPGPKGEQLYRCPFCRDSQKHPNKGHLYLNSQLGKYWCARCWAGGYAIGLYARVRGIDTKAAYRELCENPSVAPVFIDAPEAEKELTVDVAYRDQVYREFLSLLTLHPRHRADILRRGLSEEAIAGNGYKSLPDDPTARWAVCRTLSRKFDLAGVPGFYRRTSKKGKPYWDCAPGPGYLIPVRDVEGRIQGFQIRCDDPGVLTVYAPGEVKVAASYADPDTGEVSTCTAVLAVPGGRVDAPIVVPSLKVGDTVKLELRRRAEDVTWKVWGPAVIGRGTSKYVWFSSPDAGANAVPHIANPGSRKVWVTEGPLKADVASFLLKETFVGIPGVGTWRSVKGIMAQLKPDEVMVAFDSDWRENQHVAEAIRQLTEDLRKAGYKVSVADWDPALGKGIDDVAVTLRKRQVVETKCPQGVSVKKTTEVTVQVSSKAAQNEGLFKRLMRLFG